MATSPKATARPGGAPLKRSKKPRPKRTTARRSSGSSRTRSAQPPKPPKPKRAKKAKPPCAYGPRGADGRCPKKPRAARKVRDYDSVSAASRQAGQVLRSNASGEQKREAVKVLGGAIAGEVSKKVGEHVVRETRKAIRQPVVKAALKKAAPAVIAAGVATTLAAAVIAAAAVGIERNHAKQAAAFANRELEKAAKRLPDLTPDGAATLWHQLYDYALKQPAATNTFLGK